MHRHLLPRFSLVEIETLPSGLVLLSLPSSVLWPPPTSHPASSRFSLIKLIPVVTTAVTHRPNEISPVPSSTFSTSRSPYTGGFFGAAFQVLHTFHGLRFCMTSSAPSCSLFRVNLSTLQDSLYVTGCRFAFLSQEVTSFQHSQSPNCTGCLLPGRLAVTRIGLSPISRRQLSGHTMRGY